MSEYIYIWIKNNVLILFLYNLYNKYIRLTQNQKLLAIGYTKNNNRKIKINNNNNNKLTIKFYKKQVYSILINKQGSTFIYSLNFKTKQR